MPNAACTAGQLGDLSFDGCLCKGVVWWTTDHGKYTAIWSLAWQMAALFCHAPYHVPAGHYELNLATPVHAAIASRLRDESNSAPDGPTWINLLYDSARWGGWAAGVLVQW